MEREALDQIIQERLERQRRLKLEGVPEDGRTGNGENQDPSTGRFQALPDVQQDVEYIGGIASLRLIPASEPLKTALQL